MNYKIFSILGLVFFSVNLGCKKLVEVDGPTTSLNSKSVYNNDATAIGSLTSLYVKLGAAPIPHPGELTSLSCFAGLSADELTYYDGASNPTLAAFYQNFLDPFNAGAGNDYWCKTYQNIFLVNAALEGLGLATSLTPSVKQQLIGEAKFMRSFYYFYLANLYGDVPLVLSTDYTVNAVIKKSTKAQVYDQIVMDLKESQYLLSNNYLKGNLITEYPLGSEERVRPSKWAATALLARTYLFMKAWTNANSQASMILENTVQFKLETISRVFQKNNSEAIWQLQPTIINRNTEDANTFVIPSEGPSATYPVYLSGELMKDFELGDERKDNWIGNVITNGIIYYYPNKYKIKTSVVPNAPVSEYNTVMRLAEQYLIRAECRAHDGNLSAAIEDLDEIRRRAGLALIKVVNPTIDKNDLIKLILKEKRIEFFTEWGHRWLDLKRTNTIDEVMRRVTPIKNNGKAWNTYQQDYPIWHYELQSNPSLTQNVGY